MTDDTQLPDDDEVPTYRWPGVSDEQMAAFFAASAAFFRATPWLAMPESRGPIGVAVPAAGIEHAVVSVMGDLGHAFGMLVFNSIEDMELHLDALDEADAGGKVSLPWHMALYFEPGPELVADLRREVGQHGWEVEAKQYPWLRVVEGESARAPSSDELSRVEALLRAIAARAQERSCNQAPEGPCVKSYTVSTHAGARDVTLEDPYDARETLRALEQPFDVELSISEDDDLDALDARLDAYSRQLLARFEMSPERAKLPATPPLLLQFLLDVTFDECDGGVTSLHADVLRKFMYELMPQHAVIEPAAAASCVKELRAFFEYLQRAHDVHAAEACLTVLDHRVVPDLRKALGITSKWSDDKRQAMRAMQRSKR